MLLIPSKRLTFPTPLPSEEVIARLTASVETGKRGRRLPEGKAFSGTISERGEFELIYLLQLKGKLSWLGGPRMAGTVAPLTEGGLIEAEVRLPKTVLAIGLCFAWGTLIAGVIGVFMLTASFPDISPLGLVLRTLPLILIPSVITYLLFFLILNDSVNLLQNFLDAILQPAASE